MKENIILSGWEYKERDIFFFLEEEWYHCEGMLKYTCEWHDKNREGARLSKMSSIIQVQRGWNRFQSRWGELKSNSVETELEWTWIRTCNLNPSSVGRSTPTRHTRETTSTCVQVSGAGRGRRGKALQLIGKWRKFYPGMRDTQAFSKNFTFSPNVIE